MRYRNEDVASLGIKLVRKGQTIVLSPEPPLLTLDYAAELAGTVRQC